MHILPFSMPVKPFKMRGIGPHRPIIMALVALLLMLPVGAIFVAWQGHVAAEIYQDYQIGLSFGKQENRAWTFQTPSGQHYLLAFVPNGGGVPVVLDRKLLAVAGLNKEEKSKLAAELKRAAAAAKAEC